METATNVLETNNIERVSELSKEDFSFFANFDITTVRIIQKFYGNSIGSLSSEINCYHVQQLHSVLKSEGLMIGVEGLRKKLEFLVRIGFLEKVSTYPRIYMPLKHADAIEKVQKRVEQLKRIFL